MPLEKKYLAIKDSQQRLKAAAPEEAEMLEPKRQELSAQLKGKEYPYFVERLLYAAKAALKTKVVKDILAKELVRAVSFRLRIYSRPVLKPTPPISSSIRVKIYRSRKL